MNTYLVILAIVLISGFILLISKPNLKKYEGWLTNIAIASTLGILICVILMCFDLRIKGRFSTSLIGILFLISTVFLFSITKKRKVKVFTGLVTIPMTILGLLNIFSESWLIILLIPYFIFQAPKLKSQIDELHNIEIRDGGFLSCGESLIITKSYLIFFDKQIYVDNNHCTRGIYKVETTVFNDSKCVFQIYHDAEYIDENPYRHEIDIR